MMADPTPEEVALVFCRHAACYKRHNLGDTCDYCALMIPALRMLVTDSTERCAKICDDMAEKKEIVCPEECAAAIRVALAPSTGEDDHAQ